LYTTCQRYPLLVGDFRFLNDNKLTNFNVLSIAHDSLIVYIIECDLHYPDHLHSLHNAYPLPQEYMQIDDDLLSHTLCLM